MRLARAAGGLVVTIGMIACGGNDDQASTDLDRGATTTTSGAEVSATCDLLFGADLSEVADPVEAEGLIDALRELESGPTMTGDAVVYLEPSKADALVAVAGDLASVAGVTVVTTADQEASYDAFVERFADYEELIEAVRPEDLPPWIDVRVDSESAHATLAPMKDDPRVREIVFRDDVERETAAALREMNTRFGPELSALSADAPAAVRRSAAVLIELSAVEGNSGNRERANDAAGTLSSFYRSEC